MITETSTKIYKCERKLPGFTVGVEYRVVFRNKIAIDSAWRKRIRDALSDKSFSEVEKKASKTSKLVKESTS